MASHDRIKILLIDDKPLSLAIDRSYDGRDYEVPSLDGYSDNKASGLTLSDYFEVRWLASAAEGREYRDLATGIADLSPRALGEEGWLPEILCFD